MKNMLKRILGFVYTYGFIMIMLFVWCLGDLSQLTEHYMGISVLILSPLVILFHILFRYRPDQVWEWCFDIDMNGDKNG